jgi:hypothetical protein
LKVEGDCFTFSKREGLLIYGDCRRNFSDQTKA